MIICLTLILLLVGVFLVTQLIQVLGDKFLGDANELRTRRKEKLLLRVSAKLSMDNDYGAIESVISYTNDFEHELVLKYLRRHGFYFTIDDSKNITVKL